VTLILMRVPNLDDSVSGEAICNNSTVWRDGQQQVGSQPVQGQQDTPSGSSEGDQTSSESSEEDDEEEEEEEGWESGECRNTTPSITAPLISGGLINRKPH
jgi:hypothetical protein